MSDEVSRQDQLELMKQRLLAGGMSRRRVLKVAAEATAGAASAAALSVATRSGASASPLTGRSRLRFQSQATDAQVFYHDGIYEDPVTFDWNANLYCNAEEETFAGLLTYDENLAAAPDWAEKFESNADATEYTFHLRKDNKGWSDGHPVTADDFVYSWRRQLDPATKAPYAGFLWDIKYAEAFNTGKPIDDPKDPMNGKVPTATDVGVTAVDQWTLKVTMAGPRGYFPQVVAYQAAVPAPKWEVDKYGDKWALGGDIPIVSNGPFKVDEWQKGKAILMSKNAGYWDAENMKLDKVVDPISPPANSVLLYEKGSGDQQLDWTVLGAADFKRYSADPELSKQLSAYVYPGIWFLLPQVTVAPFDKLPVRKALSHAVDSDRLATVTNNLVTPAQCMMPQGLFGFLDDPSLGEIQKYDPQLAMDALKGTEYEGGKNWPEVTVWMRANEENYNADIMVNDIVDQIKKNIGLDVKIQQVPQSNFTQQLFENKWQLVFIRWWSDYPDPQNSYGDMFYSANGTRTGRRQAWTNKDFDDLVNKGKGEPDQAKRLDIYLQAEKIIQNDVGYIPLVYRVDNYVFKPWVKGLAVNKFGQQTPDGNMYVRMLTKASISGRK